MECYKIVSKVIDERTKLLECVAIGINDDLPGYTDLAREQGYDHNWYLAGYAPTKPAKVIMQEQIDALEAQQTPRLYREALAGGEFAKKKLAEIEAKIEELREQYLNM